MYRCTTYSSAVESLPNFQSVICDNLLNKKIPFPCDFAICELLNSLEVILVTGFIIHQAPGDRLNSSMKIMYSAGKL